MTGQTTWVKEVIEAFRELGGQGALADIYTRVEERGKINLSFYKD